MAAASKTQSILLIRPAEILVVAGGFLILMVMALPIPAVLLDILLSFSIAFSLVILLAAVFMEKPLEFSVFPSLLLIVTFIRLSLNVASTRIILLNGNEGYGAAGQVIHSFGSFVVGGNFVVGAVIFLILSSIYYFVAAKGSVGISEAADRQTFEVIPAKLTGINADLNAGTISGQEASAQRRNLEREADFFRSMTGSFRFARLDAVAGILMTLINIIGGLSIGIFQLNMGVEEAARVYTLLAIGDGLAYLLPGLAVAAAGIAVTRSASEKNLAKDLIGQLGNFPAAFVIAAGAFFLLALVPGLPHFPFFLMSALAGAAGFVKMQERKRVIALQRIEVKEKAAKPHPVSVESTLYLDIMELQTGHDLKPLSEEGQLPERIISIRRHFALDMGFIVPQLCIRENLQLKPNEYSILIKGVEAANGSVNMERLLAMNPGTVKKEVDGIKTKDPVHGLPALWIVPESRKEAQAAGYIVEDPADVIAAHIKETIKRSSHELLGRQEVQVLLDKFRETNPKVVDELVPDLLSLGKVQKTLQNLLMEQVSIRDLRTILEQLADSAQKSQDTELLTEHVRHALSRPITKRYQNKDGSISVLALEKGIEEIIEEAGRQTDVSSSLALEPAFAEKLLTKIKAAADSAAPLLETSPIILTSPIIRRRLRRFTARYIPDLAILSHNEIIPTVNVKTLKVIALDEN